MNPGEVIYILEIRTIGSEGSSAVLGVHATFEGAKARAERINKGQLSWQHFELMHVHEAYGGKGYVYWIMKEVVKP
jgi:hypothetical protein